MKEFLTNNIFEVISNCISNDERTFVIGGFVRDIFLNRPSKDIDIVTEGSGIELAKRVALKLNMSKISIFKNYGTAMIKYKEWEIEFVGTRKESYREDSRNPSVEKGSIDDDQKRRDFTINAMAICLNKEKWGELTDPFNGKEDIDNKTIKTPLDPSITFSDDPLRMMRAIRFATQLNFKIENSTFQGICNNCDRIEIVSKERINEELHKIILSKKPSIGFKLLDQSGLLKLIFRELHDLKGIEKVDGNQHKENFLHSIKVLDRISAKTDDLWLRWASLLHDIGKAPTKKYIEGHGWTFHGHDYIGMKMVKDIFKKMKLPLNEKMKFVEKMVLLHLRPIAMVESKVSDNAIRRLLFDAGDDIDSVMLLCEADITSANKDKVNLYLDNFALVREKLQDVEEKDKIRNWQPPLSGEDIMQFFNITPCKEVGIIKNAIKDAILDGKIENNVTSAKEFMIQKGIELGLNK